MGKLLRIELQNFKSYQGKHIVGPFDNFSCIIGPNGSGKSNMMDAISFVLGINSKYLRSNNLKELIYRKDINIVSAKKASVKIIYEYSNNENHIDNNTIITFKRTISSSGVSSYQIDDTDVSYNEYDNTLSKIGVLVKARNFLVFQGDVESVASKSPQDLTKLIEQISGSDQYAAEYEELLRKRDEAEENTIFNMQKKKMYLTQCKEVKGQKDEAEYFQGLQSELNERRTEHVLWQIWCIKLDIDNKQNNINSLKDQLNDIQNVENELEEELINGKRELAKASKAVTAAEKEVSNKNKQIDKILPNLTEIQTKIKSLQRRITELNRNRSKVEADLQQQQDAIAGLQGDISALTEVEQSLREELDSESNTTSTNKLNATALKEYTQLKELASERTAAQQADEQTISLDLDSKQKQLHRLQKAEESRVKENESTQTAINETNNTIDNIKKEINDLNTQKVELQRSKEQIIATTKELDKKEAECLNELEEVTLKLSEVGDAKRRSKQEERMNEAIASMQHIQRGVYGKLVDLCRPTQRKYAQAVTVAAGRHMDAVVVESKTVAAECMRYLKDQRVGVCTFLPLDNITAKPVPERLRNLGSHYRPCVDLIECEERFKPAVSYAVGAALVCETLEEAQELCFNRNEKVHVVTLRGHSIGKSGAMTGGVAPNEGKNRWEEKELDRLRLRKTELEDLSIEIKRKKPSRSQVVDIESKIRQCATKVSYKDADIKALEEKLNNLQQQYQLRESVAAERQSQIESMAAEIKAVETRLTAVKDNINVIESEVFAQFNQRMGITNIRDYEEITMKNHQELLHKHAAVVKQKAELEAQLQYETARDFQVVLQRLNDQIANIQAERETAVAKSEELINNEGMLRDELRECNVQLKTVQQLKSDVHSSLKECQSKHTELIRERDMVTKKITGEEMLVERGRSQLHDILQRAQVDEVALPTVEAGGSTGSNRKGRNVSTAEDSDSDSEELIWTGSQSQHRQRDGSIVNNNSNRQSDTDSNSQIDSSNRDSSIEGHITASTHFSQADNPTVEKDSATVAKVDLSAVRRKYKNLTKQQSIEVEQKLTQEIEEITAKLETIQPNMHAAERYDGVVGKLKDCNEGLEGSKEIVRDIAARFEEIRQKRQELFKACFDHVAQSLDTIYKDLTRSSKHPLGGNAYLTLDNSEEPYLAGIRFTAMPPMKRFRDMEQLSGGEKTMAALALLFSIHSFRQAPFFVLDEVDAALDNVNVKKICNYIKQRSEDFQCIVISLKDIFFEHADSLVGICKDIDSMSSQVLTLDLNQYEAETIHNEELESPAAAIDKSNTGTNSAGTNSGGGSAALGKRRSPGSMSSKGKLSGRHVQRETAIEEEDEEVALSAAEE